MVRFAVESWAPDYGTPAGDDGGPEFDPAVQVDATVETPLAEWQALPASPERAARDVLFVDGVRRIDARLWFDTGGRSSGGIAASFAAGVIRSRERATVEHELVGRGVFAPAGASAVVAKRAAYELFPTPTDDMEHLQQGIQAQMGRLETEVAQKAGMADLLFLDGPLTSRTNIAGAIGYIKSHQRGYLPEEVLPLVGRLRPGERTPLFLTHTGQARFSWYLRLPIDLPGHPWAGIARCEVAARGPVSEAAALAERATATLQRFASTPHKDTRAPQNLFPIAGLENHLRHRLGDREFLYRQLLQAAASTGER
jgi:hypothetical protein